MVWKADAPQGFESAKVAFDLVPYMAGDVLDLGCGPKKVFPHVTGIDNNADARLFGVQAQPDIFGDCTRLTRLATDSWDAVFSSHLIEHIVDYEAALAEWWRLVKVGGYLILYCPHADHYPNIGMPGANPDHKHDFRNEDLHEAMTLVASDRGSGWDLIVDEVRTEGFEYSILQIYRKRADARCVVVPPAPKPEKSLGIVRLGAYGDALWISAVLPYLKAQGWHITLYTQKQGETSLRHDPNIDRIVVQPEGIFGSGSQAAIWQSAYWLHEERKFDKFINLVGCVERHILPHQADPNFYLPFEQRARMFDGNYLEAVFEWAGVPYTKAAQVRFTPTAEERAWAMAERARIPGPLVVVNPAGSSLPKWWPHFDRFMELMDAAGVYTLVVGDLRETQPICPPKGRVIGTEWDIRKVFALAALADVVVGVESAVVNSVSYEAPLKIVLLSHSSANNLTRDWTRTVALVPEGLACYPCHRIHQDMTHCTASANGAACQDAMTAESVADVALQWIRGELKEAA